MRRSVGTRADQEERPEQSCRLPECSGTHACLSFPEEWLPSTMTWRAPPAGSERQDPRVSGQEAYLGRRVRECTLCTRAVAADARQDRGTSATTEFSVKLGALPRVAAKRLYLFVLHGRRPNAVASARSATARARASAPGTGRPGSTSNARHGESDQATAYTAPQRRQRKVGAESIKGLRSQQLGQTAYFPSSAAAGGASSGLRRTSDHIGGRSGRICRNLRGIRSSRLLTSRTVSSGVSSTTRYHAPRRSGQSIPARTRAQYCTCGILALSVPRSTDECQGPRTGRLRVPDHVGARRIETVTSDTGSTFQMPIRRQTVEGPPRAVGRLSWGLTGGGGCSVFRSG